MQEELEEWAETPKWWRLITTFTLRLTMRIITRRCTTSGTRLFLRRKAVTPTASAWSNRTKGRPRTTRTSYSLHPRSLQRQRRAMSNNFHRLLNNDQSKVWRRLPKWVHKRQKRHLRPSTRISRQPLRLPTLIVQWPWTATLLRLKLLSRKWKQNPTPVRFAKLIWKVLD